MIIKDEDALKRLNSPMNLINKLKNNNGRKSAMSLFGLGREYKKIVEEKKTIFNPFEKIDTQPQTPTQALAIQPQTTLDNILENHESQIKLGLAHDNALALLNRSVDKLVEKLDEVKADKLPAVISSASKVVESIRKERVEANKNQKDREVHYHFYTPEQKKVEEYEVIDVA